MQGNYHRHSMKNLKEHFYNKIASLNKKVTFPKITFITSFYSFQFSVCFCFKWLSFGGVDNKIIAIISTTAQ